MRPLCVHCGRYWINRPRRLCYSCHLKPDIRLRYPPIRPDCSHGPTTGGYLLPEPTDALPGTPAKVVVLTERAAPASTWPPVCCVCGKHLAGQVCLDPCQPEGARATVIPQGCGRLLRRRMEESACARLLAAAQAYLAVWDDSDDGARVASALLDLRAAVVAAAKEVPHAGRS